MNITDSFLAPNPYSRPQRPLNKVKAIIWHWVANPNTSAMANRNFFENRKAGKTGYGSAHYIINLDGDVVHDLPDDEMAYHIGSHVYTQRALDELSSYPNNCTIGIECTHVDWDGRMTDATYKTLIELTVKLLKEHGLDEKNIWLHFETNGWKDCHRWFHAHSDDYKKAKEDVSELLHGVRKTVTVNLPTHDDMVHVELYNIGDRGNGVKALQTNLEKLGYELGSIDSIFGSKTEEAVKKFQGDHHLTVDGLAGEKTLAAIKKALEDKKSTASHTQEKAHDNLLRKGDHGSKVHELQEKLLKVGEKLPRYGADSDFGKETEDALMAFQSRHHLQVDGIYGSKTAAALNESIKNKSQSSKSIVPYPGHIIQKGSSDHHNTKRIQHALGIEEDGIFGNGTKKALMNYQKDHHLQVDGKCGPATWRVLF